MIVDGTPHVAQVKSFFEAPQGYFERRQFDISIRKAIVREFTANQSLDDILDIGCGNGSISIPLLEERASRRLTLLDLSERMLELARAGLTDEQQRRTSILNADLMTATLDQKYDLIICLGVLAHVDSPGDLIKRIRNLLKPGGRFILEVTDSYHPVGRMLSLYHGLLAKLRPVHYSLNKLRIREVFADCESNGLRIVSVYRYSLPPPGSQRIFSHDALYRMTRGLFGSSLNNSFAWLGNIAIAEFSS